MASGPFSHDAAHIFSFIPLRISNTNPYIIVFLFALVVIVIIINIVVKDVIVITVFVCNVIVVIVIVKALSL